MLFKTTKQIFADVWASQTTTTPPENYHSHQIQITESNNITNIDLWEEVYFLPGTIGVYVAAKPRIELYLVTYGVFSDRKNGSKVFSGNNAGNDVKTFCSKLGIDLKINS